MPSPWLDAARTTSSVDRLRDPMPATDRPRLCRVAGRNVWHIYHRRRRFTTGCAQRAEAERELAKYIAELARPTEPVATTVGTVLALYLKNREDAAIPGLERIRWAHKPLTRFFGQRLASTITETDCRAYVRQRATAAMPVGTGTIRTELQALSAACRWAVKQGILAKLPPVVLPPRAAPRQRWLTREEAALLVKNCRAPHVRLFVLLALNTAARRGAILDLTWDRVDLERGLIDLNNPNVPRTRKGRARVPINATLLAELKVAQPLSVSPTSWNGPLVR